MPRSFHKAVKYMGIFVRTLVNKTILQLPELKITGSLILKRSVTNNLAEAIPLDIMGTT